MSMFVPEPGGDDNPASDIYVGGPCSNGFSDLGCSPAMSDWTAVMPMKPMVRDDANPGIGNQALPPFESYWPC